MTPTRRFPAALVAGALAAAGLAAVAAVAAPAAAVSDSLAYDCTNPTLGAFTATAVVDTDAPAQLGTGVSVPLTVTATVVIPESVATTIYGSGGRYVDGTGSATGTVDGAPRQATLTVPSTAVPATGPITLVGSGPAGTITGGAVGSTILIGAGSFEVTLNIRDDSKTPLPALSPQTVTCTLQSGQPTLVDSVSVVKAPTTTTVTVDNAPVAFGDSPTVSAAVAGPGGSKPAGSVAFTYGGKTITVVVKGGKAKATALPSALTMGTNTVTAVFTPTAATLAPSTAAQQFKVVKAPTTSSVTAVYRPAKDKLVAKDKVVSAFATPVEGSVKLVLKRDGVKIRTKTVELNRFDVAKWGFRNIRKAGTYTVVGRYLGSTTLKRSVDNVKIVL